jgi:hypothetical protein
MERAQLTQALIDKYGFRSYLEIGVRDGDVFFTVKCKNKIAVDPKYSLDWKGRIKRILHTLFGHKFYTLTSDIFFNQIAPQAFKNKSVDVVLVDGMHEFDFALRDIENSLKFLSKNGFIIVHDCNPLTKESACSFSDWKARNYTGVWNGDVWKAIHFLNSNREDINVVVLDTDHGLGIISRSKTNRKLKSEIASKESIANLTFDDLAANRETYLNLRSTSYLKELV